MDKKELERVRMHKTLEKIRLFFAAKKKPNEKDKTTNE